MSLLKHDIFNVIRDDGHKNPLNRIFSTGITALIILNISMVLLDLLDAVPEGMESIFHIAEVVTVAVFTVEFVLRLWTADLLFPRISRGAARVKYVTSLMAIVDILAIVPFYLPMAFPVNMTILRLLRLLRLLRVMKLNRYSDTKTAEVVLATIHEAVVLIDRDHNFIGANDAAHDLFPLLKGVKKHTPITDIQNWPDALTRFEEDNAFRRFSIGERHYSTKINQVSDGKMILRYIVIIHDVTELAWREKAEKERAEAVTELVNIMKNYGEGNFDCEIRAYEGDWAWANEALSALRQNITNALDEIDNMAKNAAEGNLSVKADESKFKGSWAELARTMNNLIEAVEKPLSQIEHSVVLMSRGDFSPIEKGDFKGLYETIVKSCNRTNEITLSYISEIAEVLGKVAQGDLTASVKRDYIGSYAPIKTALDTILKSLNETMSNIQTATEQVTAGAGMITQNAAQLAEGVTNQSAAIQELTAAMETISQGATDSAASASEMGKRAANSTELAAKGDKAVNSMLGAIDKVKESSEDISKIIKVISDIAFQTNLLALNAAVEAARAGEHGKGFSVVAEEVRNLAGKSRNSTDETVEIIKANEQNTGTVFGSAANVADAFDTIAMNIQQMSAIIETVVEKSKMQADSVCAVNAGINEIAQVVQNNAAASQESAAASQELNAQAEMLRQLVSFFKLKKG